MSRLGLRITPHDVRDAGTTTWAIFAPDQIGVARDLVGVDNHSGLAQEQAKMKLAPPQVFQPPFPYSLGIVAQGKRTAYVAGQVALNDKGELVGKDDPEAQARQVFTNMKAVLAAAGAKMDDVVKITMIIRN